MPLSTDEVVERARRVRLLVFDVDGVLTDGRLVYGPDGEATKTFHVRDGFGIVLARLAGIPSAILSARDTEIVRTRMRELGVFLLEQGAHDKAAGLRRLAARTGIEPGEMAYMGDDVNDLPVFDHVLLSSCPADAAAEVRVRADFVAVAGGGQGAARELCERVLAAQGKWKP